MKKTFTNSKIVSKLFKLENVKRFGVTQKMKNKTQNIRNDQIIENN